MFATPAERAGVLQFKVVEFTNTTEVQFVPWKRGVDPDTKFVPVITTAVPPAVVPLLGVTLTIVGRAR